MKYLIKRAMTVVSLSAVAVLLTACSSVNSGAPGNMTAGGVTSGSAGAAGNTTASATTYGVSSGAQYQTNSNGFKVNAKNAPSNQTYYFSFASSNVKSDDMSALMAQANYLASHPSASVRLEGNTDNRGSREYNIGLGWRRDQSVARLLEQQGVRPSQIQMVSYGKQNPAVAQNNERAWALNRRVAMVYKNK